jgi:predicted ATPase/DNA-binding CsgD family transcriptional regulator
MEHWPLQSTPFIGREAEIAGVTEMLADSNCRLLTLAGQGGIGKSRLAIEIATRSLDHYPDGIHFVDLQAVYTYDSFLQVIADALGCPLSGPQIAFQQLLGFLRDKDMMLLLDNFEQLLPVGAEALVSELLTACPKVTILVTSRELLNLRQEWVWRVTGMAFPDEHSAEPPETYDAVQLFSERARHVRANFLVENDLPHILEICRLVDGMPLAIELAACWLKVLPCKAIADEIRQNLDLLNSHQRDIPERHRSIRVVFEQCWKFLTSLERDTINRLSIFKGGFRRDAAERIVGADLTILLQLADKSLLRLEANGRFYLHELVRQYAAEMLGNPAELRAAHCAYYVEFLHQREADLCGGRQFAASEEIAEELDNVRAAWEFAVAKPNFQALAQMSTSYALFCQFRSRYQEAYNTYFGAIRQLAALKNGPEADRSFAILLVGLGWIHIRMGQIDNAESNFQQADEIFAQLGINPSLGYGADPSLGRAVIALVRGDYGEAERLALRAIKAGEIANNVSCLSIGCRTLAEAYLRQGKHDVARQYALRAYQLCDKAGDRWFMAYCLTTMGEIALEVQAYAAAKKHFEDAYLLRKEIRDPEGMALALAYLGDIALLHQSLDEALRMYDESRSLYQQINDPGGLARVLCGLSRTNLFLQNYQSAAEICLKALRVTVAIQYIPVLSQLLAIAGELCYAAQSQSRGLEILTLVANHAAASRASKTAIQQFLARNRIDELPTLSAEYDLQNTASLLEAATNMEWTLLEIAELQHQKPVFSAANVHVDNQPLFDPLSARELEVLAYIAAGLQNREIANRLVVSLNTVKTHINNIYSKLGVTNRVQAVTRVRDLGLL